MAIPPFSPTDLPLIGRASDVNDERLRRHLDKVAARLDSLVRAGYLIQSGINTWQLNVGAVFIGTPITGGAANSVLFIGATGLLSQDSVNLTYNAATHVLSASTATFTTLTVIGSESIGGSATITGSLSIDTNLLVSDSIQVVGPSLFGGNAIFAGSSLVSLGAVSINSGTTEQAIGGTSSNTAATIIKLFNTHLGSASYTVYGVLAAGDTIIQHSPNQVLRISTGGNDSPTGTMVLQKLGLVNPSATGQAVYLVSGSVSPSYTLTMPTSLPPTGALRFLGSSSTGLASFAAIGSGTAGQLQYITGSGTFAGITGSGTDTLGNATFGQEVTVGTLNALAQILSDYSGGPSALLFSDGAGNLTVASINTPNFINNGITWNWPTADAPFPGANGPYALVSNGNGGLSFVDVVANALSVASVSFVGFGANAFSGSQSIQIAATGSSSASTVLNLDNTPSATAAPGFGNLVTYTGKSTTTQYRNMSSDSISWITATDASRAARRTTYVYYTTTAWEAMRIDAISTGMRIGFAGAVDSSATVMVNGTLKCSGDDSVGGQLVVFTAGKGISIKTGSNAKMGSATLASGSATINTTAVTANSYIFLSDAGGGVANIGSLSWGSVTAGTGFQISSNNVLDSSAVRWLIIEPA